MAVHGPDPSLQRLGDLHQHPDVGHLGVLEEGCLHHLPGLHHGGAQPRLPNFPILRAVSRHPRDQPTEDDLALQHVWQVHMWASLLCRLVHDNPPLWEAVRG